MELDRAPEEFHAANEDGVESWEAPSAPPQLPAKISPNDPDWIPPNRPRLPIDQRPSNGTMGEDNSGGFSKLGQGLIVLSAAGSLLMILAKFLNGDKASQNPIDVVTPNESRSLRNAEPEPPIFPYPKSLSIGKNADELYEEGD